MELCCAIHVPSRKLRFQASRIVGSDCDCGVLRDLGPGRPGDRRAEPHASLVAGGRRIFDGRGHLGDALHRNAGLQHAFAGALRFAHGFVFAAGRHRGERDRALYRQPPTDQELVNIAGQRFHGMRNCSDALHRHGCNALARSTALQPGDCGGISWAGYRNFLC